METKGFYFLFPLLILAESLRRCRVRRVDAFFGFCFTRREKSVCDIELQNDFCDILFSPIRIWLLFCGANTRESYLGILIYTGKPKWRKMGTVCKSMPKYATFWV